MRIVLIFIFILTFLPHCANAQFVRDHKTEGNLRSFHSSTGLSSIKRSFESDVQARSEFVRILSAIGLNWVRDRITLRASADTNNAEANIGENGERFIFYNAIFMEKLKQKTGEYWTLLFILAHELGHHIAFHTELPGRHIEFELEADYFAGFVLRKMGASLDQTEAAVRAVSSERGTPLHPGLKDRLQVITTGWTSAGSQTVPSSKAQPPNSSANEEIDGRWLVTGIQSQSGKLQKLTNTYVYIRKSRMAGNGYVINVAFGNTLSWEGEIEYEPFIKKVVVFWKEKSETKISEYKIVNINERLSEIELTKSASKLENMTIYLERQ